MSDTRLTDGLDSAQIDDLGDLHGLAAHLAAYDTPEPDSAALLARLAAALTPTAAPIPYWLGWLRLAQSQISLLNARFWWATLLMLCLGAALVFTYGGGMMLIYVFVSPVLAVVGTAYLFRPETRTLHEFELFSAYRPLELLYIRLLMVLAYTSGITLLMLLVASTQGLPVVIWRLLLIWIGPMIGMTGLALYTTVRWNAFAGAALPMGLWATLMAAGWHEMMTDRLSQFNVPQTLTIAVGESQTLILAALVSLAGGVLLIWRVSARVAQGEMA